MLKKLFNGLAGLALLAPLLAASAAAQPFDKTKLPKQDFYEVLRQNNINPKLADGLPHKKIAVAILPAGLDRYLNRAEAFPSEDSSGTCNIYVTHPSMTRAETIHQLSTIPRKYVRPPSGPDLTFLRVLFHEARHCDQYSLSEDGLAGEVNADLYGARVVSSLPGGAEEAKTLKYMRAVRGLLGEGTTHVMALALDAQEKGQPVPGLAVMEAANQVLYDALYAAGVLHPDIHGYSYEEEGDLLRSVYHFLKDGLAKNSFDTDPLARRAAELYVEGLEALAPGLLAAHSLPPKPPYAPAP